VLRFLYILAVLTMPLLANAQQVIPLTDIGGLHSAYVVPRDDFNRVDVQLIVLSGSYDDPTPSGTAHFVEHLTAFSADTYVLRQPRERDLFAKTSEVATIYTNSGAPGEIDRLMKLSRAILDTPKLPQDFLESEIKIVQRETFLRERQFPTRWLKRMAIQNLYGSTRGRASNVMEDVSKLNLASALAFHKEHYAASNVMVIISGNITPKDAADQVRKHFGDTSKSIPPAKWWLDVKPKPDLRHIAQISSNRLSHNTVVYTKFIDLDWVDTSIDLQGEFFIGIALFESRIRKALIFDNFDFLSVNTSFYLAKNGDLEMSAFLLPMPGVDFETALSKFETAITELFKIPLTTEEISTARQKNAAHAASAARRPTDFLFFLENVGSDGLPPVSTGTYAKLIQDTADSEVVQFLQALIAPAATSIVFADKQD
jgi:zinc protease